MALSIKKAEKVAKVMAKPRVINGPEDALTLMEEMSKAAYGPNYENKFKSFKRIRAALEEKTSN